MPVQFLAFVCKFAEQFSIIFFFAFRNGSIYLTGRISDSIDYCNKPLNLEIWISCQSGPQRKRCIMIQILFKIANSVAQKGGSYQKCDVFHSSVDVYRILQTSLYQLYIVFWRSSVQTSARTLPVLTELCLFCPIFHENTTIIPHDLFSLHPVPFVIP